MLNDFTYYYTSTTSVRLCLLKARMELDYNLKKLGQLFQVLTPVCRHVIEHMKNHFLCFVISACSCKTFQRRHLPQILYDCNVNDLFNINKRGEIITRCESLILVTGLAPKHRNHPNYQMAGYRSLHRSYENKTNSFFNSQIRCLLLTSLLINQLLNKALFSKINRSTWHKCQRYRP